MVMKSPAAPPSSPATLEPRKYQNSRTPEAVGTAEVLIAGEVPTETPPSTSSVPAPPVGFCAVEKQLTPAAVVWSSSGWYWVPTGSATSQLPVVAVELTASWAHPPAPDSKSWE